ncbi:MAG: lipopolysaccharide kinase InaA family protein [Phycisphaerae bacterium]
MGDRLAIESAADAAWLAAAGLASCADFIAGRRGTPVARTRTSQTQRVEIEVNGRREACYLKQFDYAERATRHRLLPHKGAIEARNYRLLRSRVGAAVPDVIAHGSRRRFGRLVHGFILTRGVPDAEPLERWWPRHAAGGTAAGERLLAELASLVARMHAAGFYHVDLQWRNILVRDMLGGPTPVVLDSSRGGRRFLPWMRWHFRMRDLSSLDKSARTFLTRPQRFRWLRRYVAACDDATDARGAARRLARRVLADRRRKDGVP